jgi:hypothetical protein
MNFVENHLTGLSTRKVCHRILWALKEQKIYKITKNNAKPPGAATWKPVFSTVLFICSPSKLSALPSLCKEFPGIPEVLGIMLEYNYNWIYG